MLLTPDLIRAAYARGWFPMGNADLGTVDWYRPERRAILPLETFHSSRRLARTVRSGRFEVVSDRAFADVVAACAERPDRWITSEIADAYLALHLEGDAHSVEAWLEGRLVGGLYGVALGGAFMAESMFHRVTDAGKVALVRLVESLGRRGFRLLDIQMKTRATAPFGVLEIPAAAYERRLAEALRVDPGPWVL